MKIQCVDRKTFELIDGSEKLGQINYKSSFSQNAVAVLGSDPLEINTGGIFKKTISVTQHGLPMATIRMKWGGTMVISIENKGEFMLKRKGMFSSKYVLERKDGQQLFLLSPDFNWKKFSYNYEITYDTKPEEILLVLLAVYSANYHMAIAASMGQ